MAIDVKDKLVTVEGLGVTLGKDASGNDVESTYTKNDFSALAVAPTPYNGNEIIPLRYGNSNYATTVNELLSAAGGGGGSSQGALVHYVKNCGTISSLPVTINDSNITSDMVVLEAVLGTPSAQTGDWSVNTADGSVTITGTINGSTNLILYFGVGMTTAPSIQTNLASTSADNILSTAPRPGVMGVLGLANGGTGQNASSNADLLSKLGAVAKSGDTMTGKLTIADASTNPNQYAEVLKISRAATRNGDNLLLYLGKDFSTKNCGTITYHHTDNGSNSNYIGLSSYNGPIALKAFFDGHVELNAPLGVTSGGTGATNAANARTNIGAFGASSYTNLAKSVSIPANGTTDITIPNKNNYMVMVLGYNTFAAAAHEGFFGPQEVYFFPKAMGAPNQWGYITPPNTSWRAWFTSDTVLHVENKTASAITFRVDGIN